jgi:hypothetical protein
MSSSSVRLLVVDEASDRRFVNTRKSMLTGDARGPLSQANLTLEKVSYFENDDHVVVSRKRRDVYLRLRVVSIRDQAGLRAG